MFILWGSVAGVVEKTKLEARRLRRKRILDQLEIAENQITFTGDLLWKGSFGEVYLVDYNFRNAAAEVLLVEQHVGGASMGPGEAKLGSAWKESQRQAFFAELQAIIRLRNPHTVNVYGAITSCKVRLVIVMELLEGGDLRTFLGTREEPIADSHARRTIGVVCAGTSVLHSRGSMVTSSLLTCSSMRVDGPR